MVQDLAYAEAPAGTRAALPTVRRIGLGDIRAALAAGWADFGASRTDVVMLCVLYPVLGLVLSRVALGYNVLPLIFPLAAGFALIGPAAGTGLYAMSRRREAGLQPTWRNAFDVVASPGFGAILVLTLLLGALLVVWLQVALGIYESFLGAAPPASVGVFLHDVLATAAGWRMIVVGDLVGALFAVVAFVVGVISFPMLLDARFGRTTGERLSIALATSVRAVFANPAPMAAWAVIVAGGLILGTLPFFVGLAVVLPVLGHATWHLYRRVIV